MIAVTESSFSSSRVLVSRGFILASPTELNVEVNVTNLECVTE